MYIAAQSASSSVRAMIQLSLFTDVRFMCEQIIDSRYSLWICVSQTRYEEVLVFLDIVLVIIFNSYYDQDLLS